MELKNSAHKEQLPSLNSNSFAYTTNNKLNFTTTNTNSVVFGSTILSLNPTSTPTTLDLSNPDTIKPASDSIRRDLSHYRTTPTPSSTPSPSSSTIQDTMIRYRECQRNHAAHLGSHVVDGCGEFMPGGNEGTIQALRCAACECHRNFHRKEVDGETVPTTRPVLALHPPPASAHHTNNAATANNASSTPVTNCYISFNKPQKLAPVMMDNHRRNTTQFNNSSGRHSTPVMMAFGGGGGAAAESSSEDLNAYRAAEMDEVMENYGSSRKRFRTKFTQEQKDKMMEFAERIGWRIQKQEESGVQHLCNELGIKRQVFKVWMHNNKQAMKRKQS